MSGPMRYSGTESPSSNAWRPPQISHVRKQAPKVPSTIRNYYPTQHRKPPRPKPPPLPPLPFIPDPELITNPSLRKITRKIAAKTQKDLFHETELNKARNRALKLERELAGEKNRQFIGPPLFRVGLDDKGWVSHNDHGEPRGDLSPTEKGKDIKILNEVKMRDALARGKGYPKIQPQT